MDSIDNVLETVFSHQYGSIVLTMFLVFYSGLAAPKLPSFIRNLFENPIFRILILSLIVYKGNKDPQLAIMIAVGFTVTMNFVSSQKFFENFADDGSMTGGDNTTGSEGTTTTGGDGTTTGGDGTTTGGDGTTTGGDNTSDTEADMNNQGDNGVTNGNNNQGANQGANQGTTGGNGTSDDGTSTFDNTTDSQNDYMNN